MKLPSADASVGRLLRVRNPGAIARLIVAVIVLAFNGQIVPISVRESPSPKSNERSRPMLTKADAASSIVLERAHVRVATPRLHVLPRAIQPSALATVTREPGGAYLHGQAAAGQRFAEAQVASVWRPSYAAVTNAKPPCGARGPVPCLAEYGPATEPLPAKFDQSGVTHG